MGESTSFCAPLWTPTSILHDSDQYVLHMWKVHSFYFILCVALFMHTYMPHLFHANTIPKATYKAFIPPSLLSSQQPCKAETEWVSDWLKITQDASWSKYFNLGSQFTEVYWHVREIVSWTKHDIEWEGYHDVGSRWQILPLFLHVSELGSSQMLSLNFL